MKHSKSNFLTRSNIIKTLICALCVLCSMTMMSIPSHADIIILTSNTPNLKSGQSLGNSATLNIEAGKRVQLILPSGKTKTLKGPFKGTVAALAKGQKSETGLFRKLMDVVKKSSRDDSGYAAVRRIGRPSLGSYKFSWTSVPADITGTYCVAEGEELSLLRPSNISIKKLKLRNSKTDKAATITWKTGEKSAIWPDNLLPKDNSQMGFKLADLGERPVKFRIVPREAQTNDDVLRTLYRRGCQKQLEAWLRGRMRN